MIFIDTEFTDVMSPQLISIGLIAASGEQLYVVLEVSDWGGVGACTEFVQNEVLPKLTQLEPVVLSRKAAGKHVLEWLQVLSNPDQGVECISDAVIDSILLKELLPVLPPWLTCSLVQNKLHGGPLAQLFAGIDEHFQQHPAQRHHALYDARVLRDVWNQVQQRRYS